MKKGLKFVVLVWAVLLIVVSLGVVSAEEINWAASANNATIVETARNGNPTNTINEIIDGDIDSCYGLYQYIDDDCNHDWAIVTTNVEITFAQPFSINEIKYKWYRNSYPDPGEAAIRKVNISIKRNGLWSQIGSSTAEQVTIPGPWDNVTDIRGYFYEWRKCGLYGPAWAELRVYELEAWGSCTPLICANYSGQCGSALDNGCGETLNCSNNCAPEESCESGVCVSEQITNFCSSPNDTIMKLFSSNNSHGALWNFKGGGTLEGCNPNAGTSESCQSCGQIFDTNPTEGWSYLETSVAQGCFMTNVYSVLLDNDENDPTNFCDWTLGEGNFSCALYRFAYVIGPPTTSGWLVCPSFERNGNVSVTANDCRCYDDQASYCESTSLTYDEIFNFLHEFFSGEIYNYNYEICYSNFFDDGYENLGLPEEKYHPDDCSNPVLWLNATYNAHAENPNINNYQYPVCYGDLVCEAKTDPDPCSTDYEIVIRLYNETNSHISNASDINYPIKICCKRGAIITPTDVYWADMLGNVIGQTIGKKAQIGDTVLMIFKNMAERDFDFIIKESDWVDGLDPDDIRTVTDTFDYGSDLAAKWTITQTDFDKGNGTLEGNTEEFYFTVGNNKSDELFVDKNSINNTPPTTQITEPVSETNYTIEKITGKTTDIPFKQISQDSDDDLKLIWEFGDGQIQTFENIIATGLGNTSYHYNNWGTKVITLRAEEMTRNQWDEDATRIYVYKEGYNVFAIIDNPLPNEVQHIQGRVVDINAKRSHAAKCFNTVEGCQNECPNPGCPAPCYEITDPLGNPGLYCYNLPQENLTMEWTFDPGTDQETTKKGHYHTPDTDEVVEFTHVFSSPGEHTLKLRVGYTIQT